MSRPSSGPASRRCAPTSRTEGRGVDLVVIHGTGAPADDLPLSHLRCRLRVTTYERRGTPAWPVEAGASYPTLSDHAADAVEVIRRLQSDKVFVCGLSFGAVIAFEVLRTSRLPIAGAVLFEPPLRVTYLERPPGPSIRERFAEASRVDPERAVAMFLGRESPATLPGDRRVHRRREIERLWAHIDGDLAANGAYAATEEDLAAIDKPVLVVTGGRSRAVFARTADAIASGLPHGERAVVERATHALDRCAWHELSELLAAFVDRTARPDR